MTDATTVRFNNSTVPHNCGMKNHGIQTLVISINNWSWLFISVNEVNLVIVNI